MSFFVQATQASRPKTKNIRTISLVFAGVLIVMAIAQLFTFEKFPSVVADLWLPGDSSSASVYSAVIVTLEVLALPFLLSMRLSPAMRLVSMVAGWTSVLIWLGISLWENLTTNVVSNSGLLGDTVTLPIGWWSVLVCLALAVLAGWSSWGMWPLNKKMTR
jgi:hypothetical protein